jgi:hypothetical protein
VVGLPHGSQLRNVVGCIRVAHEIHETHGIAMYLPNPNEMKCPKPGLINNQSGIGIGDIF